MRRRWTTGQCWLWCERTAARVLWLGPVQSEGGSAPLYACEPCIRRLEAMLRAALIRGTGPAPGRGRWATGACWLWCERIEVPTLMLGTVERGGHEAPLTVCDSCLQRLEDKVRIALAYVPS